MKILTLTILILTYFKLSANQLNPEIPCPETFSYYINTTTNQTEGRINVVDIELDKQNAITVKLAYPPFVRYDHNGNIAPTKSKENLMLDIQQKLPVVYRIDFPTANPLPIIQEIVHNGKTICSRQNSGRPLSEVSLNFFLKLPKIDSNSVTAITKEKSTSKNANICGVSSTPISSIIQSKTIKPEAWPWLAGVYKKNPENLLTYYCGATIIATNAVLTVAHCFFRLDLTSEIKNFRVGLGIFDHNNLNDSNTIIAEISQLVIHPDFHTTSQIHDADIALITLDKSYRYTDRIRPICMWIGNANPNDIENEEGITVSLDEDNNQKPVLNIYTMEIVSSDTCLKSNALYKQRISGRNFCAGYLNGQGPCYGDSGNGLMIERNGKLYLRGLVVGNIKTPRGECDFSQYTVYSDAAKFRKWIKAYVEY